MQNKDIKQLNIILGSLTFKTLGDELFLPMLEALDNISKLAKKAEEIELAAIEKLGLEVIGGQVSAPNPELREKLLKVIEEIGNKETAVDLPKLTIEQFKKLSDENVGLKAADLLLIKNYFVK